MRTRFRTWTHVVMLRSRTTLPILGLIALLLAAAVEARGAGAAEAGAVPTSAPATAPSERPIEWMKQDVALPVGGGVVRVLELKEPKIAHASYAIRGQVKYADVKGKAYIEMWSHFPDGSFFFSRTLDTSGPMGQLQGTSDWREFVLPFFSSPGKLPSKLEVNIVLPHGGSVQLGEAKLVQPLGDPAAQRAGRGAGAGAWWTDRQGGRIGGVLGSSLGIIGAAIGGLTGTARSRRLAVSLAVTTVIFCGGLLLLGFAALLLKQPYAVCYPLVLCGGIGTVVVGSLIPAMKRRYAELELRKMSAADVLA